MGIATDWILIRNFVISKVNIKLTLRRTKLRVPSNLSRVILRSFGARVLAPILKNDCRATASPRSMYRIESILRH